MHLLPSTEGQADRAEGQVDRAEGQADRAEGQADRDVSGGWERSSQCEKLLKGPGC